MQRDELRADKGTGRLSRFAERQVRELNDPAHPRQSLGPETELELVDERVALAADDERKWCRGPSHSAKHSDEPTCDDHGRVIDMQRDTPTVGVGLGPTTRDFFDGLPELDDLTTGIDDAAGTDLSTDDLNSLGPL